MVHKYDTKSTAGYIDLMQGTSRSAKAVNKSQQTSVTWNELEQCETKCHLATNPRTQGIWQPCFAKLEHETLYVNCNLNKIGVILKNLRHIQFDNLGRTETYNHCPSEQL